MCAYRNIIWALTQVYESKNDMCHFIFSSPTLNNPVSIKFVQLSSLSEQMISDRLIMVLQSFEHISLTSCTINFIHAQLPPNFGMRTKMGSISNRKVLDFFEYAKRKKCLIQAPVKNDGLCCGRGLIGALLRLKHNAAGRRRRVPLKLYNIFKHTLFECAVHSLYDQTGVKKGPTSLNDIRRLFDHSSFQGIELKGNICMQVTHLTYMYVRVCMYYMYVRVYMYHHMLLFYRV